MPPIVQIGSILSLFSRASLGIWLTSSPLLGILFLLRSPKLLQWRNRNHSPPPLLWMTQHLILRESFFVKTAPWSLRCNGVTMSDPYPSSSLGAFVLRSVFFFLFLLLYTHTPPATHWAWSCSVERGSSSPQGHLCSAFHWIVFSRCCSYSILLYDTGLST